MKAYGLRGFTFEKAETGVENQPDILGEDILTIEMPKEGFTNEAMTNLENLIQGKGDSIKALGIETPSVELSEETISFWFNADAEPEVIRAYTQFIAAICEMANAKAHLGYNKDRR